MSEEAEKLARALLDRTREEIARADQKASILLASSGIAIGALLGGLFAGKVVPFPAVQLGGVGMVAGAPLGYFGYRIPRVGGLPAHPSQGGAIHRSGVLW